MVPQATRGGYTRGRARARAGIEHLSERRELIGVAPPGGCAELVRVPAERLRTLRAGADRCRLGDVAEICAFLAAPPPSVAVPELTVLPAARQALGRT